MTFLETSSKMDNRDSSKESTTSAERGNIWGGSVQEHVNYLIISKQEHQLSLSLKPSIDYIHTLLSTQVSVNDLQNMDMTIIVDDGFDTKSASELQNQLMQSKTRFKIVICHFPEHKKRWKNYVDSVFVTDSETEQHNLINRLIESIELAGLVCIDYSDVYFTFCKMETGTFYQASSSGEDRVLKALKKALSGKKVRADKLLMTITAGYDLRLEEFEIALDYIKEKLPELDYLMVGTKLFSHDEDTKNVTVSIFAICN